MGSIAKDRAVLSANVALALVEIIDERAAALSMTRSKFASLVFDWWEAQGCPPVTNADEAVQILKRGKGFSKK